MGDLMEKKNYLEWLSSQTPTAWWHDSGDPSELEQGKAWGAVGATTNPVLVLQALRKNGECCSSNLKEIDQSTPPQQKAQLLTRAVVRNAAGLFERMYNESKRQRGYVCAQLDPALAADRDAMIEMAKHFSAWAPNVSVKFPATSAGLDALEECVAQGSCATSTVSFTVPQVIAAAERYEHGRARAERAGLNPSPCFAVIMIGRIDDYLREVALDRRAHVLEEDIKSAGLAVTKRAYSIFRQRKYRAKLLIAALRGPYHMTGLCGAEIVMSIHPKIQKILIDQNVQRGNGIEDPIPKEAIKRLQTIPEFIKAYEPNVLHEQDFITFGVTQKTLSQFSAGGWSLMEAMKLPTNAWQA